MKQSTLQVKNMVCDRCIMVVKNTLEAMGARVLHIELGYVQLGLPAATGMQEIAARLQELGFELLPDKESAVVEQIKVAALHFLHHSASQKPSVSLSSFLADSLGRNYSYLSKLFSRTEGRTIEQYFIRLKIEKAKELIAYDEMSLGQIATLLGYSSVNYLSNQFKKVTGISPTAYRSAAVQQKVLAKRVPFDKV